MSTFRWLRDTNSSERSFHEDMERESGSYTHECCVCGRSFIGHKHRLTCRACITDRFVQGPQSQGPIRDGFGVYGYPTPELISVPIKGTDVPARLWNSMTNAGILVKQFVLSITERNERDQMALATSLPPFMVPSIDLLSIDDDTRRH